jgi:hypothetical protein
VSFNKDEYANRVPTHFEKPYFIIKLCLFSCPLRGTEIRGFLTLSAHYHCLTG